MAGSFSAVSKRNFARKYAFDSIIQALQDLHTSAPLQSQHFSKHRFEKSAISVKIQQNFCKYCNVCKSLPNFKKCQLDNLVDFFSFFFNLVDFEKCWKNAYLVLFTCKDRRRYSRKRAKFCRNFAKNLKKIQNSKNFSALVSKVRCSRYNTATANRATKKTQSRR